MTYPLAAILAKVAAGGFLFAPWLAKHPYKGSPVQPYGAFCTLKQAVPRSRASRFGAPDGLFRAAKRAVLPPQTACFAAPNGSFPGRRLQAERKYRQGAVFHPKYL